jgi:hypothetical protein
MGNKHYILIPLYSFHVIVVLYGFLHPQSPSLNEHVINEIPLKKTDFSRRNPTRYIRVFRDAGNYCFFKRSL